MSLSLLDPLKSQALNLKNRIALAPMTRGRADNPGHVPPPLEAEYYVQRAGAGLLITEGTHISPGANGWENVPGIYTEEQVAGWRVVTEAVHKAGSVMFCQLWHEGRMSHPDLLGGAAPIAPSAVTAAGVQAYLNGGFVQAPLPREASTDDIKRIVSDFRHAAECADKAGFDGVEIHGANGYLVHQFLSDQSNLRTDEYGGSVENRARFLFEVLDAVGEVLPGSRMALRLSPSMNDMSGMSITEGTNAVFEYVIPKLSGYKLAYLHLMEKMKPIDKIPFAIQEVARHFRPKYEGVLMDNSGFTFETGNELLTHGFADLVSFGHDFIANPDLVERFATGTELARGDKGTFYTPGADGYTTYPKMEPKDS